ncbi:predicted protein [Nematostella vectensis]|uniref:Fatty acid desaturase domain-containing protein n=1 Tax=Nematostella vectensis TaxID=45351 RepID=A7S7F1_NEMVE|nr:predicted protein [Nematostella vectensis]|eukprot:XP_001632452.1 predicted protein [Nematostella vectensis]
MKAPTETPPFTLKDLKNAVPAHCFERSFLKSTLYLIWDLLMVVALLLVAIWVYNAGLPWYVQVLFWPAYWFCQGCVLFGVWIVAHECGHYSYCDSKAICDWLGLVLHTVLLVPYHSWRISHSHHHRNTNRMDGDEAFVPNTRTLLEKEDDLEFPNVFRRFYHLVKYLTIGWPAYLFFHARGRPYHKHVNHFNPSAPIFKKKEFWDVVISDVALALWVGFLVYLSVNTNLISVLVFYGVPYLVVNMWLVIVTYLQHTDITVPHYDDQEWTWLKGALCTIDRDYGLLNTIFHNLTDAHVAHHLFSYMPHYHIKEATEAIKPILGKYYNYDPTPVWQALWKSDSYCRFVEDFGGVRWYKAYKHE